MTAEEEATGGRGGGSWSVEEEDPIKMGVIFAPAIVPTDQAIAASSSTAANSPVQMTEWPHLLPPSSSVCV